MPSSSPPPPRPLPPLTAQDWAILNTAQDALETKWATVQAGYFQDPYLQVLAQAILCPSVVSTSSTQSQSQSSRSALPPLEEDNDDDDDDEIDVDDYDYNNDMEQNHDHAPAFDDGPSFSSSSSSRTAQNHSSQPRPLLSQSRVHMVSATRSASQQGQEQEQQQHRPTPPPQQQRPRRTVQPLIKRGTFARVCCTDRAISCFLEQMIPTTPAATTTATTATTTNNNNNNDTTPKRKCQVVVLGAGFDTSYFRLLFPSPPQTQQEPQQQGQESSSPSSLSWWDDYSQGNTSIEWYEVDHTVLLCHQKATILEQEISNTTASLFSHHELIRTSSDSVQIRPRRRRRDDNQNNSNNNHHPPPSTPTNDGNCSCTYIGHDLRTRGLLPKLQSHGFDPTAPTLVILECVQMYLPLDQVKELLQQTFLVPTSNSSSGCHDETNAEDAPPQQQQRRVCFCCYEPMLNGVGDSNSSNSNSSSNGGDGFGTMMESNLKRAGLAIPNSGLLQIRTLSQHLEWIQSLLVTALDSTTLLSSSSSSAVPRLRGWACDLWTAYSHPDSHLISQTQRQLANQCEFLDELEEFILIMQHYCFLVVSISITSASTSASDENLPAAAVEDPILQLCSKLTTTDPSHNNNGTAAAAARTTLMGFPIAASQYQSFNA